jgi:hypothetical protein
MDYGTRIFWAGIVLLLSASVFFAVTVEERRRLQQGVVPASTALGVAP